MLIPHLSNPSLTVPFPRMLVFPVQPQVITPARVSLPLSQLVFPSFQLTKALQLSECSDLCIVPVSCSVNRLHDQKVGPGRCFLYICYISRETKGPGIVHRPQGTPHYNQLDRRMTTWYWAIAIARQGFLHFRAYSLYRDNDTPRFHQSQMNKRKPNCHSDFQSLCPRPSVGSHIQVAVAE